MDVEVRIMYPVRLRGSTRRYLLLIYRPLYYAQVV